MKQFEYYVLVLEGTPYTVQERMNFHGLAGWELICVTSGGPGGYPKAYFKREKPPSFQPTPEDIRF